MTPTWTRDDLTWMTTVSGKRIDFRFPHHSDLVIRDIAHSLGMKCRYNGHSTMFYSVAEHCVHVAEYIEMYGGDAEAYHALLHDADEAYLPDLPRGLKNLIPGYLEIEARFRQEIAFAFSTRSTVSALIKDVDTRIVVNEKAVLFPPNRTPADPVYAEPLENIEIIGWTPREARDRFLMMYMQLWQKYR